MSELLRVKVDEIEQRASRERAAAEYIINFIEGNMDELREAFIPAGADEPDIPEELYLAVVTELDCLGALYTRVAGVTTYGIKPGETRPDEPRIKLGWAKYFPAFKDIEKANPDKAFPHLLFPTEKGVEIINGLRTARGHVSLEEQRRINHARHSDNSLAAT